MGIETEKYIRKPLIVSAVRITTENFNEVTSWCMGEVQTDEVPGTGTTKKFIKVRVNNPKNPRQTKGFVGDWILYTDRGYKVYTNKAFHHAFDLLAESEDPVMVDEDEVVTPFVGDELQSPVEEVAQGSTVQENEQTRITGGAEGWLPTVDSEVEIEIHSAYAPGTTERAVISEAEARDAMGVPPREEVEETPIAPPPTPAIVPPTEEASEAAGKRVLSLEDQRRMTRDEIRAEIQTGEVILAQDLAESQQA